MAGGVILTGWPFTMAFIMPVNKQLLETEKCIEERGKNAFSYVLIKGIYVKYTWQFVIKIQ